MRIPFQAFVRRILNPRTHKKQQEIPLGSALHRRVLRCRRHPPDRVADIVGHQQRAWSVDGHPDWPAEPIAGLTDEARENVGWPPRRMSVSEWHIDHLVPGRWLAVP